MGSKRLLSIVVCKLLLTIMSEDVVFVVAGKGCGVANRRLRSCWKPRLSLSIVADHCRFELMLAVAGAVFVRLLFKVVVQSCR